MKPILSYYRLKRASQLLEIEVDDIVHLWLMNKLSLLVDINGVNCTLARYYPNDKDFISAYRILSDKYHDKDIKNNLRWFVYEDDEDDKGVVDAENKVRLIHYRGVAYGLWRVFPTITTRFIDEEVILSDNKGIQDLEKKACIAFVHGHREFELSDQLFFDMPLHLSVGDLVIDAKNFNTLDAIINGEYLENPDECNQETSGFASVDLPVNKRERLSSPQKIAIKVMANKLYPDVIDSPENLANALTADAEKQGIKSTKFDSSTVARWFKD
ncbi:hypothetical protein M8E58_002611 [Salmonella enterica]|nr:hypothetical protein [Salmonella enterica subsp. enterica serovar Durham]EEF0419252.1 hypothetical protein [Salmonella enterica subsp. enterica serovar Kibi]EHU5089913.1 hypothetical protein [Salmonella enterica]EHV2105580.1 hypothetical protein [Salmonella enterica]EHV2109500.1 hypothetical protein [Salmonella enterica]